MTPSIRNLSVIHILGTLILIIACVHWAKAVFMPIALAILLTFVLNPVVSALHSRGLPRTHAVLVAVAFRTWLWGAIGLILATPVTVCIGVLGKYVLQIEFIGVLLGDEPTLEVPTNYYQRLVAHDQDEAVTLVEAYLETHPPSG